MLAPFSGPWLVGTTKVYPGPGADIVMESIALIDRMMSEIEMFHQFANLKARKIKGFTFGKIPSKCRV